jgi:tetratricopeptide (TPR) repeat protein
VTVNSRPSRHGKHRRGSANTTRGAASQENLDVRRSNAAFYWALAVGVSAVLCYVNAVGNDFVLDDARLIRDNLRIRSLANVPNLFATSYWDVAGPQALYRPLVLVSYAVNYAINGLSPGGYTVVNIALHAGVSLLLFALVRAIGGSLFVAGAAGIAFAVHPVHTEAVAGISGRPELLAAVFFLLAMHLHRLAPGARTSLAYRAGTLVCFAGALLSKESAMTLILILPVMDALFPATGIEGQPVGPRSPAFALAAPRKPATARQARIVTDYLPLAGVAVAYLLVRRAVLGSITISESAIAPLDNPLVPITEDPFGGRMGATAVESVMTAFAVVVEYARLLVWPARLSPDYSYNQIPLVTSTLDGRCLGGVALVAVCLVAVALLWRRNRIAAFGLAFLALTFSIVSNFLITIGTICAERLMYLPSAGALMAAGVGLERLAGSAMARRRLVAGAIAILIVLGAVRTLTRNRDWNNEVTLWSAAVQAAPSSARVQSEYGRILMAQAENLAEAGRTADAEQLYSGAQSHFETALNIYPSYSPAIEGLAMIHSLHGRFEEAIVLYERAVQAWPGNFAALTNWGSALWERARRTGARAPALHEQGRIAEANELIREADAGSQKALEKIDRAIAMMPFYAHAHLIRAQILDTYASDRAGAIAEFEEVLRLMPNHPQRALVESELQRLRAQPGTDRR